MLARRKNVSDDLWHSLGRNIAPGAATRRSDTETAVPLERFLAARNWLAGALTAHQCDVAFDDELADLLERENDERVELDRVLSDGAAGVSEDDVVEALNGSRFIRSLMPFQLRDLAHVLSLSNGANFSVPGAGKTAVAYACYEAERMRGRVDRLLVVAPISAFDAWTSEASKCMDPPPVVSRFEGRIPPRTEVLLVNYQRLAARYQTIVEWVMRGQCHVILDEAHRMKRGRDGEWGSACLDLAHLAVRRDILTGTPAPQHPRDFVALLDFLWPHQSLRILPPDALRNDPPADAMATVSHRLQPLFARTKKDELGLDLPILRVEEVTMGPLQSEIYEALRSRMRNAVRASARDRALLSQIGEVVMYLVEAATNPALLANAIANAPPSHVAWPPIPVPADSTLADRVLHYAEHEVPKKFEKLAAMVAANAGAGRKTLVWTNFVINLEELAQRVLAPHEPALIYGAIPSSAEDVDFRTRESELRRFREDDTCTVLLANPAAMSEGVSLHEVCHDAVYLDRTFNAGQYLQSLDRIHRLGLPRGTETRISFLVSHGTVDETVDQRVRVKAQRLSEMLSDPNLVAMALPDDEAYGEWVDAEDLDALFAHLSVD